MSEPSNGGRAAVLVVFTDQTKGREVLLIRRRVHEGDPWSGQLAFPGGHEVPEDKALLETALREAEEEVGLYPSDLSGTPKYVGSRSPGNRADLSVSIFMATLSEQKKPDLMPGQEASEIHWVPVSALKRETRSVPLPGSSAAIVVDGFACGDLFIWGLTYRILLEILG